MASEIGKISSLNNHTYKGKGSLCSILDTLSLPLRFAFGGRNVSVLNNQSNDKASIKARVAVAFLSILVFPVGVGSFICLTVKLSFWTWEHKKIKEQKKQTKSCLNQFKKAFEEKKYKEASEAFLQKPELATRSDLYGDLLKLISEEIHASKSWNDLEKLLFHCKQKDAEKLIHSAVEARIEADFAKGFFLFSGNNLLQFILNSIHHKSIADFESCLIGLLSKILRPNATETQLLDLYKVYLADYLINYITREKKLSKDVLIATLADTDETRLLSGSKRSCYKSVLRNFR